MFENQEIEAIAALTENGGYKLLIQAIQAEVNNLEDELETTQTRFQQDRTIAIWRATKKVLKILQFTPEHFRGSLAQIKDEQTLEAPDPEKFQMARDWAVAQQRLHLELLRQQAMASEDASDDEE